MNGKHLLDAMGGIDSKLIAGAAPDATPKKPAGAAWVKWVAIAACFCLIVGAIVVVPMFLDGNPEVSPEGETATESTAEPDRPSIPIENAQAPSSAPQYYGSESSSIISDSTQSETVPDGISVVARFIEALPDTYTFFDDWKQTEFRLIKMQTVSLITGSKMTDEFYFIVPVAYMTDLSVYDSFVIAHMGQFGYDFSVLYNVTKQCAESVDTVIFGDSVDRYSSLSTQFMAFDENDMLDLHLWSSTEAWHSVTKSWIEHGYYDNTFTKQDAEDEAKDWGIGTIDRYVHTLDHLSGETSNVLEALKSFECGVFVPTTNNKLWYDAEPSLTCRRYINGFATNETIRLEGENTVIRSVSQFSADDLNALPNLPSAYATIKDSFKNGEIHPPHIQDYENMENTVNGIIGWYAKTDDGIIGIIRVTWCYVSDEYDICYDDAYFIVEYGSDVCERIDRDALLEKHGDFENVNIYEGEYDALGKVYDRHAPVV